MSAENSAFWTRTAIAAAAVAVAMIPVFAAHGPVMGGETLADVALTGSADALAGSDPGSAFDFTDFFTAEEQAAQTLFGTVQGLGTGLGILFPLMGDTIGGVIDQLAKGDLGQALDGLVGFPIGTLDALPALMGDVMKPLSEMVFAIPGAYLFNFDPSYTPPPPDELLSGVTPPASAPTEAVAADIGIDFHTLPTDIGL